MITQKIKVSYLIALYNKDKFIEAAVNSIINDSSDNYDIEICIVDDGSTDNSLSIVNNLFSNNPSIKIDSFKKNKGKNSAYNKAFSISTGDYISLVGADDEIMPGRTQTLLDISIKTGKAVYGNILLHDLNTDSYLFIKQPTKPCFYSNIIENSLSGGAFLCPRLYFEDIFPIPENLKFEDWWISFHLLKIDKVITTKEVVLLYNVGTGNDCASLDQEYESIRRNYIRHPEYLNEFRPHLTSKKELKYLNHSIALRDSFFGKSAWNVVFSPILHKSIFTIVAYNIIGSKNTRKLISEIRSIKKKISNLF